MKDLSAITQVINDLISQNKIYEAYQRFESEQFRFFRRCGLEETIKLFIESLKVFAQSNDRKYQIAIVKLLWSHVTTNTDIKTFTMIVEAEIELLRVTNTFEPEEEWDQILHQIVSKTNSMNEKLSHKFRIALFHFYQKFGELSKALKHCIYLETGKEIGIFLATYAIDKLPNNEWDLLITNFILQILQLKAPQKANDTYKEYIRVVKEPLGLGDSPPYGPILLNYSRLIIDAAIENKPNVMDTIHQTYLPTIKSRDGGIATLYDMMFFQCYPNELSQNRNSSSNVLLNLANQFLGSTSNTTSSQTRNYDFGLD